MPGRTVARGYGAKHKRDRRRWAPKVRAGKVDCARCGKPIVPGTPWDLGHDDDDRSLPAAPEHRSCNRAAPARRAWAADRGEAGAHDCREEFNPKGCAECRRRDPCPTNTITRWSMHWEALGVYNPRCPFCRKSGVACESLQVTA